MTERHSSALSSNSVFRTAVLVTVVVALALLVWQLADVLLLGFAAILFAIVLRSIARPIEAHTRIARRWSLALAVLLIVLLTAAFFVLLGTQIHAQASQLMDRFPELIASVGQRLGIDDLSGRLAEQAQNFSQRSGLLGKIAGYTSTLLGAVANLVLACVAAVYLAAQPERHRAGALMLIPQALRDKVGSAFDNAGRALRLWLFGQLVSMMVVGVLATVGLYLIGMPSALALGFLAGVSEFVPLVGPALAAIPAILVALSEGGTTIFWVLGLYLAIQQLENNIIMPLVHRRTVELPPVVTLFAILALGVLFGPVGVLLGAPLTVVLFVAVKQLYLRETLGERTDVPGET